MDLLLDEKIRVGGEIYAILDPDNDNLVAVTMWMPFGAKLNIEKSSSNWKVLGELRRLAKEVLNDKRYDKSFAYYGPLAINRNYTGQYLSVKTSIAVGDYFKESLPHMKGILGIVTAPPTVKHYMKIGYKLSANLYYDQVIIIILIKVSKIDHVVRKEIVPRK